MFHARPPRTDGSTPCDVPFDAGGAIAEAQARVRLAAGIVGAPGRATVGSENDERKKPWSAAANPPAPVQVVRPPRQASKVSRLSFLTRLNELDFSGYDLAPDLAVDIGSARWCRGLMTLIALVALALAFWPDFSVVSAHAPVHLDDEARDEYRSNMIMPLALGADTGRKMPASYMVMPLKSAPERPQIEMTATLARGDSFRRMLERAGVGNADIERTASLVSAVVPLGDIAPGTQVDITLGRRPEPGAPRALDSLSFRARFDMGVAVDRKNGGLILERRPVAVDATPLRIQGVVGNSLYRSARAAGAPASAVQAYLSTMGEHFDLDASVRQGDKFDIILEYRRAATGESKAGRLLYAGLSRDGKPRAQLMRWGSSGQFFEASGVGQQRSGLLAPVNGPIGSRYGMRRHPILGYLRMHRGLDFRAGYGQPIVAVTSGRVLSAGRAGGCGNTVKLAHAAGLATRYCHMSRIAVRAGQGVRRGQVIGYVGSTGLSTGPHLHYEMYRNGQPINPQSVSYVTSAQLSGGQLADFRARLKQLQSLTPGAALKPIANQAMQTSAPIREIEKLRDTKTIAYGADMGGIMRN